MAWGSRGTLGGMSGGRVEDGGLNLNGGAGGGSCIPTPPNARGRGFRDAQERGPIPTGV